MARFLSLSLLVTILQSSLAFHNPCIWETDITITVSSSNSSQGTAGCKNSSTADYQCQSLQDALEMLPVVSKEDCMMFNIILDSGIHYITQPVSTNASVYITSMNISQRALITCDYDDAIFRRETGGLHTIYFNQSLSVTFSEVNFRSCPLPIRIYQATNVTVERSSFR